MSEDTLRHLTQSPYDGALKRYRRIAAKVVDIKSVRIKGDTATIRVHTKSDAIVNGRRYPHGTAIVEMIGEGNEWKFGSYNDADIVFLLKQK